MTTSTNGPSAATSKGTTTAAILRRSPYHVSPIQDPIIQKPAARSATAKKAKQLKSKINHQPQMYFKPTPPMSIVRSPMEIPVAHFCRLPGTGRCLMQAAPSVPGQSRNDLHSKPVSWLKKPIYISNEPTKFQPKYVEYFSKDTSPPSPILTSHPASKKVSLDTVVIQDDVMDTEVEPPLTGCSFNDTTLASKKHTRLKQPVSRREGTHLSFKVINLVSFYNEFKVTVYLF